MTKKYSKSETPSLGKNQAWAPTSKPSPYRPQLRGGAPFVPTRNDDMDWDMRWHNPVKGAKVKTVEKRAK